MRKKYQDLVLWLEDRKEWLFLWFVLALLLVAFFGFGYFIGKQANPAPIIIEQRSTIR